MSFLGDADPPVPVGRWPVGPVVHGQEGSGHVLTARNPGILGQSRPPPSSLVPAGRAAGRPALPRRPREPGLWGTKPPLRPEVPGPRRGRSQPQPQGQETATCGVSFLLGVRGFSQRLFGVRAFEMNGLPLAPSLGRGPTVERGQPCHPQPLSPFPLSQGPSSTPALRSAPGWAQQSFHLALGESPGTADR